MKYEIGKRIRQYREAQKLTQKQLAERIGVSNTRVSNWEQGLNRPDADILAALCCALHVSPSELLDVHLAEDELTARERRVLHAYRDKPELQSAVHLLLGIE